MSGTRPAKIYVDNDGTTAFIPVWSPITVNAAAGSDTAGAYFGGCYKTIQAAINAASSGDIVNVKAGTYNEKITCKDGVSVVGESIRKCVIQRAQSVGEDVVTMAEGMELANFKLEIAPTAGAHYGVKFANTSNRTSCVRNVWIQGTAAGGTVTGINDSGTGVCDGSEVTCLDVRVLSVGFANGYIRPAGFVGTSILQGCRIQALTAYNVGAGTVYFGGCRGTGVNGLSVSNGATAYVDQASVFSSIVVGATGTLLQDGSVYPKHNLVAATNPLVSSDRLMGYAPGSTWVNTVTKQYFVCVDATAGIAVWQVQAL